ncbi:MAG: cupin-like domain-containing protein [Flavobacteriales bacterium]
MATSTSNDQDTMTKAPAAGSIVIERRRKLSYEEFKKDYLFARKPVIITDATAKWKASGWTPQWFKERYADKVVSTDQGKMRMDDFIDAITKDTTEPGPFLREQPLTEVFPDLADHVQPTPSYVLPNWLGGNYLVPPINKRLNRESKLEINFCGRRIFPYLHIDDLGVHAFITQHYGDKEFTVFPPDQEQYLYRQGTERFSQVQDVDNPDLDRFPLFAKAKAIKVVLHAGESVFMPCGWWHTTKVPGTSLSTVYSVSNSSNWSELVGFLEENSSYPKLAPLFSIYLRTIGSFKSLLKL